MPLTGLQVLRLAPGWQLACIWLWVALPAISSFIILPSSFASCGFARPFDVGCWMFDVGCSVFTISLQNATSLPRLPGVAWGRSGQTLDILWYHRTPSNPRFRSATLIPLNHGGCVLP